MLYCYVIACLETPTCDQAKIREPQPEARNDIQHQALDMVFKKCDNKLQESITKLRKGVASYSSFPCQCSSLESCTFKKLSFYYWCYYWRKTVCTSWLLWICDDYGGTLWCYQRLALWWCFMILSKNGIMFMLVFLKLGIIFRFGFLSVVWFTV